MRREIREFVALGHLPDYDTDADIEPFATAIHAIPTPVSDVEAEALMPSFGKEDCFGLAWTLLHIIETSPNLHPKSPPSKGDNEWKQLLWQRSAMFRSSPKGSSKPAYCQANGTSVSPPHAPFART
ncbi:hypothetical protein [Pseudorhodobacter sp.]|uniref:hypothetical protein n=1 Tax=Pseudorhodobacter sp. TaxID=1934400 RepID=UPI002647D1AF|nr:hypothetical protein [Pseudorhodobacter sp.]MDN5786270.1 hypothetical protein [Pseudorhodobacter sp.]